MADAKVIDPAVTFRFEVNVSGILLGFSKVTGLREEQDVIEYREGTDPTFKRKFPGLREFPNVSCQRGMGPGSGLVDWRNQTIAGKNFRRDVTITIKSVGGDPVRLVKLQNAWPVALEISDLDAAASEVVIETLEIAHEGQSSQSIFAINGASVSGAGTANQGGTPASVGGQ